MYNYPRVCWYCNALTPQSLECTECGAPEEPVFIDPEPRQLNEYGGEEERCLTCGLHPDYLTDDCLDTCLSAYVLIQAREDEEWRKDDYEILLGKLERLQL